jgi:formamidopyrimidine-DNA glycosylase
MIELPEAVVLAGQISDTLGGKRIRSAVANASPHKFAWYTGDPAMYGQRLARKTVQASEAYGNHVEIHADEMLLVISTPAKYHAAGDKLPKKHQLLLEFDDGTAMSCTVQMWGGLLCFPKDEEGGLPDYQIAKNKPSPLSEAFDRAYFDGLFPPNAGGMSAKAFLATEQRIPGLGNGVLQDILWTAKIHPKRKIEDLSAEDIRVLYDAVKSVLQEMAEQGGRNTERDLFGHLGGYSTVLSKNTVGTPCPDCGATVKKGAYLGGSIYYCPGCQQL